MTNIGDSEKSIQKHVIRFFQENLNYGYLGNLSEQANSNVRWESLHAWLVNRGFSKDVADKAIDELIKTSTNLQQGLYHANKETYSLLKYGAKIKETAESAERTVYFIDFENPGANTFSIAEEVTVVGKNTKRPDLVVYVNGIALAVIELKKSTVSVSNGIRQNLTNQSANFIEKFFTTIQFCMAGNTSEGLQYGTLLTPEKKYLEWHDDGYTEFQDERNENDVRIEDICREFPGKLDRQIYGMFQKTRFLDLIHNFVIFDKGIKKVCRYNQYYAIKRTQCRLVNKHRGGIVWHTQGSGKSLTMVWLSKWILSHDPDARVLIVTDREELDDQIEKTFLGVDEKIIRTTSGRDLLERLNKNDDRSLCSLVHKFGHRGSETSDTDYEKYVEDLLDSLPSGFSAKGNIVVFVDECHRTQSGKLHVAMKAILPNAILIGFTGTPLLKRDKKTSLEIFGGYIHAYKFDEGVRDHVILDLRYEAKDVPQSVTAPEKIDAWFDAKTAGLTPTAKAKLKSRWGNLQNLFSSSSRLEKIANDIIFDFETKARLKDGSGNALLVADSVYSACRYYEIFQSKNFTKCAVISSYLPQAGDLRTDTVDSEEKTETSAKYNTYLKMIGADPDDENVRILKKVEDFEKEAKRKFVEEPANMKLLIVVDKLLTGFDAPPCTYLYIDKAMHDHGLFQAICRVNRLDGESKDFGYIVDYKELFGDLTDVMTKYTSGAFEDYDDADVDGILKDRTAEAKKYFETTLEELEELCEGVEVPREELQYIHFFCGKSGGSGEQGEALARAREKMYRLVSRLLRAYAEFKPRMAEASYTLSEREKTDQQVGFYLALRDTIGKASGDFIDLHAYDPGMRFLIDNYVSAAEAERVGSMEDFTLLDFILKQEDDLSGKEGKGKQESSAETIENNIRKKIVERLVVNPAYYAKMSEILSKLIDDRNKGVVEYGELLDKYAELARKVSNPETNDHYPEALRDSGPLRAFYDYCGEDEKQAVRIHQAIRKSKQDGFRNNPVKENKIKRALYDVLKNTEKVDAVYSIAVEQEEY